VELKYVESWQVVVGEIQRIARVSPNLEEYGPATVAELLTSLPWEKAFDFCERIYSYLAQEVVIYNFNEPEIITPKSAVQEYIASELQRLFFEEHLAFEFSNGLVRRRGRRHTANQVASADLVLGDPRFAAARRHFSKALKYFRNVSQPDFENVVKEAVCSVEAVARDLFPGGGTTLGDVVKSITGNDSGHLPKAIASTFHGLYGFSSGGVGVRHGGAAGGAVTKELAEYVLAMAASQVVLLVDLAKSLEEDVPF
jgi:hypothetical protein